MSPSPLKTFIKWLKTLKKGTATCQKVGIWQLSSRDLTKTQNILGSITVSTRSTKHPIPWILGMNSFWCLRCFSDLYEYKIGICR